MASAPGGVAVDASLQTAFTGGGSGGDSSDRADFGPINGNGVTSALLWPFLAVGGVVALLLFVFWPKKRGA